MTAIVAVRSRGRVWVGGDSLVTWGDSSCQTTGEPKVWRAAPHMVCGAAGDASACDIAVMVRPPERGRSTVREWMVTSYVPALREAVADAGDPTLSMLVAVEGELLELSGWGVLSHTSYAAIGSGGAVALGALAVMPERSDPRRRVLRALEAAERHSTTVRRPWTVLFT